MANDIVGRAPDPRPHLIVFLKKLKQDQPLLFDELLDCLNEDPSEAARAIYARVQLAALTKTTDDAHLH